MLESNIVSECVKDRFPGTFAPFCDTYQQPLKGTNPTQARQGLAF